MTQETMKEMLKGMTEESDDAVLSVYLCLAGDAVLSQAYPYQEHTDMDVPEKYHAVQVEIAAYMLNKRGAEGQISHSENGISRGYESGNIPTSLLRRIIPTAGRLV